MKVAIIGAGAMGCLLGASLAQQNNQIWLVDIWEEHIQQIKRIGLTVTDRNGSLTIKCNATTSTDDVGPCDLVVISTKYHQTRSAVQKALPLITENTLLMTVQNGIGNVDIIAGYVNPRKIIFGLTTLGSVLTGPGSIEVSFSHGAVTHLWPLRGEPTKDINKVITTLNESGLVVYLSADVRVRIWKKICLNAGFSVITAITGLTCGDCIAQPHALDLIRGLIDEICTVASKDGVLIDSDEAYRYVVGLAQEAPEHRTSFLIDIVLQRKTEIDCLNGAIVAKATKYNLDVPFNKAIVSIVKTLENTYETRIRTHH